MGPRPAVQRGKAAAVQPQQRRVAPRLLTVALVAGSAVEVEAVQHLVRDEVEVEPRHVAFAQLVQGVQVDLEVAGQLQDGRALPRELRQLVLGGQAVAGLAGAHVVAAVGGRRAARTAAAAAAPPALGENAAQEESVVGVAPECLEQVLEAGGPALHLLQHVGEVERLRPAGVVHQGEQLPRVEVAGEHPAQVVDDGGIAAAALHVEHLDHEQLEHALQGHGGDGANVVVDGAYEPVDLAPERRVGDVAAVAGDNLKLQPPYGSGQRLAHDGSPVDKRMQSYSGVVKQAGGAGTVEKRCNRRSGGAEGRRELVQKHVRQ